MNLKKLFGIIFGLISLLVIVACGPQQVTVTFNTNGGTAVETLTIEQGTIITEPVTTKTGYTFGGWYENQDFTGSSFDFSKEIVRHITLYAKWTINSYTINFFPDNGQTIPSITKNYNEDIVLPTVTKEGHVFGGWYQNPNFTGEAFTATKMPAANTNLYAKWTPIEITITFYINDEIYATRKVNYGSDLIDIPTPPEVVGKVRYWDVDDFTNITEPMDVNLIEENAVYTVTIVDGEEVIETLHVIHGQTFEPTVTPSKVGYNFVGYFPALGTIITEDTVVTIVYQQITFQVTFYNENGGVIGTPQFVPYGGSATAPNYIPADGYDFIAWDIAFNNITQNTSVTAIVQPKQYSITLHGNGGTFVNNQETHVITADYQSTIGVPPTPTRPGYNFSGWYSNPEGTGNATNFGPGATMPLNGLELYARWTLRNFRITYENTFGLIHANPSSYTVETNPIILSNQIANRPGYTFVGWFDALNGGNQVTTIDTSILSDQTVYGRWVPNTYTITYNGLNGATNEGNPTTYTIESDSIELSAPGSRTGYTFDGWYADSSYTTPVTGIVSGSTGSRTFWAKWVAKTYTVTYNTSGGNTIASLAVTYNATYNLATPTKQHYVFVTWTYNGNSFPQNGTWTIDSDITVVAEYTPVVYTITYQLPLDQSHENSETFTVEDNFILLPATTPLGYTFDGWFTQATGGTRITNTSQLTSNVTLHARYQTITYTITYYGLEGASNTNRTTYTIETDTFNLLNPGSRIGYTFGGWFKDEAYTEPMTNVVKGSTGDLNLYAKWNVINYNITYNGLEGATNDGNPSTYHYESGAINFVEPGERIGYTFLGWFDAEQNGNKVTGIDAHSTGAKIVYAYWEAKVYDINYHDVYGTNPNPLTYTIETNILNLQNAGPRTGYTFSGWFTDEAYTEEVTSIPKGSFGDLDLYAKWTLVQYTINYQGLNGATNIDNPTSYTIESVTITLVNPGVRTGYTFDGWYSNPGLTTPETEITSGSTGNKTFYAKWVANTYTITFDVNGGDEPISTMEVVYDQPFVLPEPERNEYTFTGWTLDGQPIHNSNQWKIDRDVTLVATWTQWPVITINLNGGSGVTKITAPAGDPIVAPADPVKTGYTFAYYYVSDDSIPYEFNEMPNGNLTIYAKWDLVLYHISYELPDGILTANPTSYTIETDDIELLDPTERIGYEFDGWFLDESLQNPINTIEKGSTGHKTIYSKWIPKTYTITFDTNGGNIIAQLIVTYDAAYNLATPMKQHYVFVTWTYNGNPFPQNGTWTIDSDITVVAEYTPVVYTITYQLPLDQSHENSETFTVEDNFNLLPATSPLGYEFDGWYRQQIGGTKVTNTSSLNGHTTLYARYTPITYTISYEGLHGATHDNPTSYTIETETFNLENPSSRIGYTFGGWFKDEAYTEPMTNVVKGSTGDLNLYAKWNVINYNITYHGLNGATNSNPTSYTIETETIELVAPGVRLGYSFAGWYDEEINGNLVTEIALGTTGHIVLYATWTANDYTISFDTTGGELEDDIVVTYSSSYILPTPTKQGYEFTGWMHGMTLVPMSGSSWNIADDVELIATWTPTQYSITYHVPDDVETNNPTTYTIESQTIELEAPTERVHYEFVGWYTHPEAGIKVEVITTGTTGHITLYSRWIPVEYSITYHLPEGVLTAGPTTYNIESDFTLDEPGIYTGFKFLGWFTEQDGGTRVISIEPGQFGNLDLYGRFEIAYYDATIYHVFETVLINESQDEITEIIETDINEVDSTIFGILHGTSISPILNFEGYVFHRFEYNGVTYEDIDDVLQVTDNLNDIRVYYRRIIFEITFTQLKEDTTDQYETVIRYVHYNDSLEPENVPVIYNPFVGMTAIWERSVFNNVRTNLNISVLFFDNETKTIKFTDDQSVIFVASQGDLPASTVFIGATSPIWNLSKPGYRFLGWYYLDSEDIETQLMPGNYAFDNSIFSENITEIYTKWYKLIPYDAPTNLNVSVNNEDDIIITWTLDMGELAVPQFEIYIDKELVGTYAATYVGSNFTLTVLHTDINHVLFADLTIVGLHSVEIRALGDDYYTVDSPLSAEFLFERKSIYDEAPTGVAVYDYFIIENYQESTRYIFYTNMTYQFNPEYTFEILTGTGLVQLPNSYSLKMGSISGTFRFRMNRPNDTSSVYDALIVKDIKGFAYGDNYQTYLTETSLNSSYLDIDAPYYVGAGSDFYLDLRMTSTQGNRIKLEDVLLDYTFYIFDGAWVELLEEQLENTIEWKPNNRFQFKSSAIGNTYRIAVTPRYKSLNMTAPILNYDVVVNEGVNVFTNQELKDAFADFGVSLINIHANITATLSQSQLNPDGSPKNTNNGAGNVYNRFDPNNKSDNLTIEGNFMTINGSNLPYANERSGSGQIPFAGSFVIVVVRIAIFNYNMGWSGGEPYQTPDPNFYNDSQFTMNNLTIIGNTTVPSVNFGGSAEDILLQERLMSRNSGGHMGVLVMGGSSTFNNVQVKFTTLAFSTSAYGLKSNDEPVKMELNKVKVDDNWANGLYMQGATLTVVNDSWFGQSGGSAFHISDNRKGDGINNPRIEINNTTVENYVSGDEAWFKAYSMSIIALQLKSSIESGIADTFRSILADFTDTITGLETEKFNFILLTEPKPEAVIQNEGVTTSASEVVIVFDGVETARPWNYLSQSEDSRVNDGVFGFPMGLYSDIDDFTSLIEQLVGLGIPYLDASNLAMLAGFYNITLPQMQTAIETAIGGGHPEQIQSNVMTQAITNKALGLAPRYFEVLASIPIFPDGYSVAIMELDPTPPQA